MVKSISGKAVRKTSGCGECKHFYGSVTVGERGQVVIPLDARKDFGIKPGDKLLVLSRPVGGVLVLAKSDVLREMARHILEKV